MQLSKLEEQIYTLKQQRLDAMIVERLIAKEAATRGVSESALLDAEVTSKVGLVTEQEVDAFYQANNLAKDDDAARREQVRSRLQSQKIAAQREAYVKALRSRAKVAVYLTPPPVQRIQVNVDGAPFVGAAVAPVTIVEFSDFHCPFCQRAEDTHRADSVALRRSSQAGVARLPHRQSSPAVAEGPRGGAMRVGPGKVLAVSQGAVCRTAEAAGPVAWRRAGHGSRHGKLQGVRREREIPGGSSEGHRGGPAAGRDWHADVLHQRPRACRRAAARGVRARDRRRVGAQRPDDRQAVTQCEAGFSQVQASKLPAIRTAACCRTVVRF